MAWGPVKLEPIVDTLTLHRLLTTSCFWVCLGSSGGGSRISGEVVGNSVVALWWLYVVL